MGTITWDTSMGYAPLHNPPLAPFLNSTLLSCRVRIPCDRATTQTMNALLKTSEGAGGRVLQFLLFSSEP